MTITLRPDQQAWLEKQVAEGRYASVEEAAQAAISAAMVEAIRLEVGELAWAKPLADAARESIARGEGMPLDESNRRMADHLDGILKR